MEKYRVLPPSPSAHSSVLQLSLPSGRLQIGFGMVRCAEGGVEKKKKKKTCRHNTQIKFLHFQPQVVKTAKYCNRQPVAGWASHPEFTNTPVPSSLQPPPGPAVAFPHAKVSKEVKTLLFKTVIECNKQMILHPKSLLYFKLLIFISILNQ